MAKKSRISFSTKIAFTFTLLFSSILIFLMLTLRQAVTAQFSQQYEQDVAFSIARINEKLHNQQNKMRMQLKQLGDLLKNDQEFRLKAIMKRDRKSRYILDFSQKYMATMGLDVLEILDKDGTLLSSGHFRNAYGADMSSLLQQLKKVSRQPALARLRRIAGFFSNLVVVDSVRLGREKIYFIAGTEINREFMQAMQPRSGSVTALTLPDQTLFSQGQEKLSDVGIDLEQSALVKFKSLTNLYSIGTFPLPLIGFAGEKSAYFFLLYPKDNLFSVLAELNKTIFWGLISAFLLIIVLAVWRARAITRPLLQVAAAAQTVSLDHPEFNIRRSSNDEIGVLTTALQRLTHRLRQNRNQLVLAEQRAAFAEIARQVNHDIKNGFIPIRNVMQHWVDVSENRPDEMAYIFKERKDTVIDSVHYLEELTRSYAQLRQESRPEELDVSQLLKQLIKSYEDVPGKKVDFITHSRAEKPVLHADRIQLRRAFENIIRNALDAIKNKGRITISIDRTTTSLIIRIVDTGAGIPEKIAEQLFYRRITTKPDGTGLGLTNVRHIVEDHGGKISLESEPGSGTAVTFELPTK